MRTIILSAGHNPRARGASHEGTSEYSLTTEVILHLRENLEELGVPCVVVDSSMGLHERILWINQYHKDEVALEVHFNSFNRKATGTEMFYKAGDKIGFDIGRKILETITKVTGLKNRGMKLAGASARGSLAWNGKLTHGILLEVCFMDNSSDMEKIGPLGNYGRQLAIAIRDAIS